MGCMYKSSGILFSRHILSVILSFLAQFLLSRHFGKEPCSQELVLCGAGWAGHGAGIQRNKYGISSQT